MSDKNNQGTIQIVADSENRKMWLTPELREADINSVTNAGPLVSPATPDGILSYS